MLRMRQKIASSFGMAETLIGFAIVAFGNMIGTNIFNMMFILGVSSLISPVSVNVASIWDMMILTVISMIAFEGSYTKRSIDRIEGIIMLLIYVADVILR